MFDSGTSNIILYDYIYNNITQLYPNFLNDVDCNSNDSLPIFEISSFFLLLIFILSLILMKKLIKVNG